MATSKLTGHPFGTLRAWWWKFSSAAVMNDKPKLRDKFFSAPPSANEGAKPVSQSSGEPPKKESLEQILEDGFMEHMKGLKIGCLLGWHVGCLIFFLLLSIFFLLLFFSSLGNLYRQIFG